MFGLPTCRHVAHQLSRSQEQPLTLRERIGVRIHLLMCHHCRRYARHLRAFSQLLREAVSRSRHLKLAPEARKRIRGAMDSHRDESDRG